MFVPGNKQFLHTGEGGEQTFFTHRGEGTFFVVGGGGYDDVDEEIDESKANFYVSKANILVS